MAGNRVRTMGRGAGIAALLTACAAVVAAVVAMFLAPPELQLQPAAQAGPPGPKLPDVMDEKTVKAIDLGIMYLVRTQRPNGAWFSVGGGYGGSYPAVMTSLAGLALMANGSTPETGPYAKNVRKAMDFILNIAESQEDGMIAGPGSESRSMYGHGFSMLFLAQCYGTEVSIDNEKRIKRVLDKAIRLTEKAQSNNGPQYKFAGGWIYTPSGSGDEGSVTVTQLQALRACRNAGFFVNKATIDRAVEYLRLCQQVDGGICYSFGSRSGGGSRPAISAAAIACFYAAGLYDRQAGGKEGSKEADMVAKLVDYVKKNAMPEQSDGGHWFYTQMYMAEAMYQRGGPDWPAYYKRIKDKLISSNSSTGQMPDGSWNGDGVGTVYGTALATIILQLPYGYLPICQK